MHAEMLSRIASAELSGSAQRSLISQVYKFHKGSDSNYRHWTSLDAYPTVSIPQTLVLVCFSPYFCKSRNYVALTL